MLIKSLAVVAALIAATPVLASSVLASSGLAAAEDRYALDVSVFRDGVQVIGGHTLIVPAKQAEMSLTDGDLRYELNADLNPFQGDGGDDRLSLYVNITHGDDQPQIPSMTVRRGGSARIEVGKKDASDAWIDAYVITLTPVAGRP